jgi:hypothetical protein
MDLFNNLKTSEDFSTTWLANMLILVVVVVLGTVAVARYFSVL